MYIPWIDLGLHPFQICGVKDCERDAKDQYTVNQYSMGACAEPGHLALVTEALELLRSSKPKALAKKGLDPEQLYFQPEGKEQRIKLSEWERLQAAPTPPPVPVKALGKAPVSVAPPPPEERLTAIPGWAWIERPGWWMNIEGGPVHISKLSTEELLDAVLAIRKANFKRITARVEWTRDVMPWGNVRYDYPEEGLQVGFKIAGFKLEEMRETLEDRELV